jgi:RNA polymerase sigma factor (sigma-70 family)
MQELIDEYEQTIRQINRYTNKLRQERNECEDQYRKSQIKNSTEHLNSMARDMIFSVQMMEEYIDYDDRHRLHSVDEQYRKQIANNRCIVGYVPEGGMDVENPADLACNVALQDALQDVIQILLSDRQQQVVKLYYFDGYTQEEIAKQLNTSQQNVAARLKDAINVLRNSELFRQYIKKYS